MSEAGKLEPGGDEKFTSPDGAIGTKTGTIPADSQYLLSEQTVLRHAGDHMRVMVLNLDQRQLQTPGVVSGDIIGMEITRHL